MKNPFTFSDTASKVKSKLTGINFETADGPMSVNDTDEPIEIKIQNNPPPPKEPENLLMSVDGQVQSGYHKVEIHNESFRALIVPQQKIRLTAVLHHKRPTLEKYLFRSVLPDNSSCSWRNETEHKGEAIDMLNVDPNEVVCKSDPYVFFISDKEGLDGSFVLGKSVFILFQTVYVDAQSTQFMCFE